MGIGRKPIWVNEIKKFIYYLPVTNKVSLYYNSNLTNIDDFSLSIWFIHYVNFFINYIMRFWGIDGNRWMT